MTIAEPRHMLSIPDATGDVRHMWNPNDRDEVKLAKDAFDAAKKKGMLAYKVKDDGSPGEVIREFDPKAGKIIMRRQAAGG